MNTIKQNLVNVRSHIDTAAQKCGRSPDEITLLAVSKTKPVSDIEKAIACGQTEFGENYVQEGVDKISYFTENKNLVWHFIGPLQSNKTRLVAEHFAWCHTIDRLKIAQRLSDQRPTTLPPLNVLIQINISDENSKSGISLTELDGLAAQISILPGIKLRGLMAIPAPENDYNKQVEVLEKMHQAFKQLQNQYPDIDTLSMGMTDDMEAAIACGSTLVRIGTAIFGARDYANK
ncbi:TPA: YggS family pyridoxal phosphate-dependent enzyme [Proteus mirabilis]|uniref:YggS family pyridoxal phosphate-dependent enzyme n=2 Tax=Bacteria TaxID=2 RepID=UPI000664FF47|nr:YggS family pyridoxal phosphate-dependent enzyme [Proteus mirabilis]ELA7683492.1 YggS family pyridoxal phosphate-dependent enzyme [Proteus mirabilis]ELA7684003.1 YggS family pyridoxal phosphate-dependent enzyme [Proteus mirabilis]MBB6651604.1 YggS family pyridoxal phosphate-dependent enzyme [Proteus mirabilis]MBI6206856.1 YggS family pyridoxal phosphate-dependent enzyme [Proteus mirabilis]MBI6374562.1 YggS family pyridoxal phosphate-dependent enzyme [Proteus mirabilis]